MGKTGDVITLYARWREWTDNSNALQDAERPPKYKLEYYTEKEWVGDQNVPKNPYPTEGGTTNDAAPIVTTPDEPQSDDGGIPPWLIVVIIAAAVVVVGGGATLAAALIKKSKKA